jgi:hypothetical protein
VRPAAAIDHAFAVKSLLDAFIFSHRGIFMKAMQRFAFGAVVAVMVVGLVSGCQKQEGPAEKAGKEVDKAVEKVGETLEKAGDSVQDAVKGEKK